jgi:CubicO group peptidase (beta-lactamase class C family)
MGMGQDAGAWPGLPPVERFSYTGGFPGYLVKRLAATLAAFLLILAAPEARQQSVFLSSPFEGYLEPLRVQAGIPGMSGVIVHDGEVIWERGFGFQNLEARIRATSDTPYPVADLSETVAAVLLLQCVEGRKLGLDDPVERWGVELPERGVTMRQLLTHTSSSGGQTFKYEPDRFARLTDLMEACAPQPYRKSVSHRILENLAMRDSVPGRDLQNPSVAPPNLFDPSHLERYVRVLERLAIPYKVDRRGRATRTELPVEGINAATGLVSTARDLARFDAALDTFLLLDDTRAQAWTNSTGGNASQLPTGLGWFVQNYRGERIVWHFGLVPDAYSSLILKIPSRRITVILLANSDGLSAPYQLQLGDVTRSVFATLFLRLFL